MNQLKMIFDASRQPLPEVEATSGFTLRTLGEKELDAYNRLRASVKFPQWTERELAVYRRKLLPDGTFVMVCRDTGELVSSAGAETTDLPDRPELGVWGWVMTSPDYSGHHLGRIVSVAAMNLLYNFNYRVFTLLTDDFRIPALNTYLKLGWQPWLYEDGMEARWRAVATILNRDFQSLNSVRDF